MLKRAMPVGAIALLLAATLLPHAQPGAPPAGDMAMPPGLPSIGKWMIDRDGTPAHWLGELYGGRKLREPVNVIFVDAEAKDAVGARRRLVAASTAAGYPVRFGHSDGYRGFVGGEFYAQLPAGRDDAFSNGIFELTNNHGRIFGAHRFGATFVSIGAFSREAVNVFRWPMHGYASFNLAREDYANDLDRATAFKRAGYVSLENRIDTPEVGTGDHDGRAVLMRAGR